MNETLVKMLLAELLKDEQSVEEPQTEGTELIGQYVIVRCRDAGVHAGVLKSYQGREVVLHQSRRLWYWKANKGHSLSGVADSGITPESKIPAVVATIILPEACEIISTTDVAEASIRGARIYEG